MDQLRPRTGFQRWLAELGDAAAAAKLRVPRRTVKSWRLGDRMPRPAQARQIMQLAGVSMDDIYGKPATDAPLDTEVVEILIRNGASLVYTP